METNPKALLIQSLAGAESKSTGTASAGLKKLIQRNMYRWHRIIGILTVVPVIFWTLSGLSHPFMSHWFKPVIAHEFIKPEVLNRSQVTLSITDVLRQNTVSMLRTFRLVKLADQTYYQIKGADNRLRYYSASTGQVLPNGDRQYAESLARYFVDDAKTPVHIEPVTAFSAEYRYVNRLLPVWKVSFNRPDRMDVYVETEQSRLANYNERSRKAFLWVFNNFHNWDWLEAITNNTLRVSIMVLCLSIIILSMVSGLVIYGFMWKRFRKPRNASDRIGFLRKYHRQIGIAVSLVTLTFAFSGAYHVTRKLTPDERIKYIRQPVVTSAKLQASLLSLPVDWTTVTNVSLATVDDRLYYQVFTKKANDGWKSWNQKQVDKAETADKSSRKTKESKPTIAYYDVQTAALLPDGVMSHAKDLVMSFWAAEQSGKGPACCERMDDEQQAAAGELPDLLSISFLEKFDREYGFINKRLPVVKLALETPDHLTYYVEPATSRLAARIVDSDRREGFSFAFLHKYSGIDFAGKDVRDSITMLAALGVLVVSLFGLVLFLKIK